MGSVPARLRGVASGTRASFQNSGTAVPIGVFFSLVIAGLAGSLPPVSSLFAARLGVNPIQHLLQPTGALTHLTVAQQQALTGREFLPSLIAGPFRSGLIIVFAFGAALALLAAIVSALRGGSPAAKAMAPHETPAPDTLARPPG